MRKPFTAVLISLVVLGGLLKAQESTRISRRSADDATRLKQAWMDYFEQRRESAGFESIIDTEASEAESLEAALESTSTFQAPQEIVSQNGELNTTLEVKYAVNQIGDDPVRLRSYNGRLVGPTLRVNPGDKLRIRLVNRLPTEPPHVGDHNSHHKWNTTNLHTHGLHVSPSGNADNVFLKIEPGKTFDYEIDVPADHASGTFWYHAHKHGAVSSQVASGMSGAIIVEGGIDTIPEIAAAKEETFVLQQIPYVNDGRPFGEVELGDLVQLFSPGAWDRLGRYTTVNGVKIPVVVMRPGEVQRWRLVHSGFREALLLRLQRVPNTSIGPASLPLNEIAVDGLPLSGTRSRDQIELWPGNRSDVLVQAPTEVGAEYLLVDERTGPIDSLNGRSESRKYIARIVVKGDSMSMSLPDPNAVGAFRLPPIADDEVTGTQEVTYGINSSGTSIAFEVDGREYHPTRKRRLQLGDVDEWTARSENDVASVHHPFHIHVNPFEIISIKDANNIERLEEPIWRDTIILRHNWTVKFRTRYETFTGEFVNHCHILDHEDQGMMETVEIVSNLPEFESRLMARDINTFSLKDVQGKVCVLNFFVGSSCPHCSVQLSRLAFHSDKFERQGVQVVCISSKREEPSGEFPYPIVSDALHELFRKFDCYDGGPTHGTIILNRQGRAVWRVAGSAPFMDMETLLQSTRETVGSTVGGAHFESAESGSESDDVALEASSMLRKDIDDLPPEELEALKHAFEILNARDPNQQDSLAFQIQLHNGSAGPCEHARELFLPWHRAHLYFFEKLLREADPPQTSNIRLPYWNWTKQVSGSRYPAAFEDSNTILYHASRRSNGPALPTASEIEGILDLDDWKEFGGLYPFGYGELELKPHNDMHSSYIAGSMADPTTAARDPIYWAFHCYVDLLWDRWQKEHGEDPECLSCRLRGMPDAFKVESVLNVENQLGYTYMDNIIELTAVADASGFESASERTVVAYPLKIPKSTSNKARFKLDSVKIPVDKSYRADLYLHPASVPFQGNKEFHDRYHFDYFVMWKSHGKQGHHPARAPLSLSGLQKRLPSLTKSHAGEDWQITVVCNPTDPPTGLEASPSDLDVDLGEAVIEFK